MAGRPLLLRAVPERRLISALVSADLESARLEWEHAYRDLEDVARDPSLEERIRAQLEVIFAELRRRVGGNFTLRELADEYASADRWARDVLAEHAAPGWPRTLALVEGAAFHLYARGAVDYNARLRLTFARKWMTETMFLRSPLLLGTSDLSAWGKPWFPHLPPPWAQGAWVPHAPPAPSLSRS